VEISGTSIDKTMTMGSQYDNNSVIILLEDGTQFRMKCEEIAKMVSSFRFSTEKKRIQTYLTVNSPEVEVQEIIL